MNDLRGTRTADAILAGTIPAGATRLLVHPTVATSLTGTADGDTGVDAEIGAPGDALGRGAVAIAVVDASDGGLDTGAGGRLAVRARDHLTSRLAAHRAERRLRGAGYRATVRIPWDRGQVAQLPGAAGADLRLAERLPRRVVVVGRRAADAEPSIFAVAAAAAGLPPVPPRPLVRSGTLVAVGSEQVVRVAVGAGRDRLDRAEAILRHLDAVLPARELLPRVGGGGEVGVGGWTSERRLRGQSCPAPLPPEVEDDVVDLLASFVDAAEGAPPSVREIGDDLASALGAGSRADAVRRAAGDVDAALAGLPAVVGHGDFWHGNLLLRDGRLGGVIDWDSGTTAQLPFLDLLHLVVSARVPKGSGQWGVEVAREVRADATPALVRRYADAIAVPVDDRRRHALVVAYWLDRVRTQVRTYGDRAGRPRWLETNVDAVLAALASR